MSSNIDYVKTNFEYPTLTKITGRPNYALLRKIQKELMANASSVTSNLGGAMNGHLGQVLNPASYTHVSLVPYVEPNHPGPLVIPGGTPHYMRSEMRNDHKEECRVAREAQNVRRALTKQLVEAVPTLYLQRFRNNVTNTFTDPVHVMLDYLFATYGDITPDELHSEKDKLEQKVFDIQQPLILLYNEVEELVELANAAHRPFTATQVVDLGVKLIRNMCDFKTGLTNWFARPTAEHTWANFKLHFDDAYKALSKVRGKTMRNTIFQNQANSVTAAVVNQIKEDNELVRKEI